MSNKNIYSQLFIFVGIDSILDILILFLDSGSSNELSAPDLLSIDINIDVLSLPLPPIF